MTSYEKVFYPGAELPITYHSDYNTKSRNCGFLLHWHEHIEILFFSHGKGTVYINNSPVNAEAGEIVVISPNTLHAMPVKLPDCTYHCIIINSVFFASVLSGRDIYFKEKIKDKKIAEIYKAIMYEMQNKGAYYQSQATAYASILLGMLAREYEYPRQDTVSAIHSPGQRIVKSAMKYIMLNYKEELTIDMIAQSVGCSKYYLCHIFKEIAGQTMIDYINILRCSRVRKYIAEENKTVTEAALSCGFNNLSYFSKTYKKYIGNLPSNEKQYT